MHAVVETRAYLAAAADAGMSEQERTDVVSIIATNPQAGEIMPGCGGARKLRVRKPGTGKSSGTALSPIMPGMISPPSC